MCDFNRRIGGNTPTLSLLDCPLVEDMLCNARTGLTKAVVTGPGRAVSFYGRHSMGEGLTMDEPRDATFLLTGAGTWVGKLAYPAADPMTIQEGKRAIAQAILDCQVKARGPGHPCVNLPAQQPFRFNHPRSSLSDEHYNNVKALNALNQELFQLRMVDKETMLDWGVCLSRHLQVLTTSFPDHFPPDHVAELKRDCFYSRLPKQLKVMIAYLKAGPQVRTISDYLRATREAEKEDSIELP